MSKSALNIIEEIEGLLAELKAQVDPAQTLEAQGAAADADPAILVVTDARMPEGKFALVQPTAPEPITPVQEFVTRLDDRVRLGQEYFTHPEHLIQLGRTAAYNLQHAEARAIQQQEEGKPSEMPGLPPAAVQPGLEVTEPIIPSRMGTVLYEKGELWVRVYRRQLRMVLRFSRNALRKPAPAVTIFVSVLEQAERHGAAVIYVLDLDSGQLYTTTVEAFKRHAYKIPADDYGARLALAIAQWDKVAWESSKWSAEVEGIG